MQDTSYRSGNGDTRNGWERFGKWLANQPMTSWGFFAAGFVIARILF